MFDFHDANLSAVVVRKSDYAIEQEKKNKSKEKKPENKGKK